MIKRGLILLSLGASLFAQTPVLEKLTGTVSVLHSDGRSNSAASSTPLQAGDIVQVESASHAELWVDEDTVQLPWDSKVEILAAEGGGLHVRLRQGWLVAEIGSSGHDWTVETPGGPIKLENEGVYRIDADRTRNAASITVGAGFLDYRGRRLRAGERFDITVAGRIYLQQRFTEVHESNAATAADMVRDASGPPLVASPTVTPHTPLHIGLPPTGIHVVR